ncbi:sensor histidine kinase [Massilia sp. CF038]|uniref:sensor histidine kinase n=1 Tax=Massilia sp. CF038 TaxID=1881045 RepID=UPI000922CBB5|nr:sensor histidine kinase [Massilia sp. CF038]SHG69332.1 two-component system, OmpR family, sensor histidine kinase TctE [Massilia sp. CF038]
MNSIRLRLLKWLIVPIILINLAGASMTYLLAWIPAQIAFDQSLADAAVALASRLREGPAGASIDLPRQAEQILRANDIDAFYFVVRTGKGQILAGDVDFPLGGRLEVAAHDGTMRGEPIRIAFLPVVQGEEHLLIGVAKTMRKRQQVRSAILRALLLVEGVFILALVGLIWFSVTNGLLPLARMRANLNAREVNDLAPIDSGAVPYELVPVVGAFNEMLGKVRAGATAQHNFLADVAHQLRTPLAGLKLQLEWLAARYKGDPDTVRSVQLMLTSNERMIRQTNQLLALARAEPSRFEKKRLEQVDLSQLVGQVVQYFVDEAGKKQIDIGFDLQPAPVAGDTNLLRDLIDNLVDNAVRYTPQGGTVTVRTFADGQQGVLEVEDSGPGIPPHQRGLVFQRYVRLDDKSTGSGLGLAIVRDIAQAHRAKAEIGDGRDGRGMTMSVRFPALKRRASPLTIAALPGRSSSGRPRA